MAPARGGREPPRRPLPRKPKAAGLGVTDNLDDEIEKAVGRAEKATGRMFAPGMATLVLGSLGSVASGVLPPARLPGAGLLFGMGMVINLLGMHLMKTWRQGRRSGR